MKDLKSYLQEEVAHYDIKIDNAVTEIDYARSKYGRSSEEFNEALIKRRVLSSVRQRVFQQLMDLN